MSDGESKGILFNTESITRFDGDDLTYSSTKWAQDIEDNAEIFGWTAQQKLVIARRSLTGTAALWLRSEKTFRTYDELKTGLVKEFPEILNSKQMHEVMTTRKKKSNESCYQYMLVMKELGKRAKFPDYVAVQYIIDGIPDSEINKMNLYGITSYITLKEKLLLYEAMKQKMNKQRSVQHETHSRPRETTAKVPRFSSEAPRCFKCGEKGHLASSCNKGVKCFRCNEYGHIGTQCKAAENVQNEESAPSNRYMSRHTGRMGRGVKLPRSMFVLEKATDGATNSNEVSDEDRQSHSMNENTSNVKSTCQCDRCENILSVNNDGSLNKSVKYARIKDFTVKCLIDTGSDINLVSLDLFETLNITCYERKTMTLTGIGSCKVNSIGKFNVDLTIDGHGYNVCFHIVPEGVIPYQIILGQPFLVNLTIVIDRGTVELRPQSCDNSYLKCLLFSEDYKSELPHLQELIDNYKPNKIKEAPITMKITLQDDIPVAQRPRRLALTEEHIVQEQIKEWLAKGVIRPSYSEYASPLVLVKKKDGSTRVCVDYRKINQKMVKDEYPLPVIDDHIDKLSRARVFSTLDLKNGFFHLPIDEDSTKYTAFVTSSPEGQYEFLRAPFGLSICPKYFTRYINIIFRALIVKGIVLIFIDDLIILAEDEQQGLERLKEVLKVASEYGLEINWKKAQLLQRSVEYLGHVVSNGMVKPSPEKTEAVRKFPVPKNLKSVHSFIGLTSYFRKFIQDYAVIAKPLSDLLKNGEFYFDEAQRLAFEKLKDILCSDPVLKIFDIQLETELHTDASKYGLAMILMQKDPIDGNLHPVHFMSRKTNETQQNCSSYELEALAVIEGVKKFRKYLIGRPFKIVTDCEAFQKTLTKKDVSAKVARWIMFLQDFDYTVVHRTGDKMQHVDSLSRNICLINTELIARVKKAQDDDETLKVIKDLLEKTEYKDYCLENGILYKGAEKKLVIPEIMDIEMIRRAHGVGHFGKKKIKDVLEDSNFINSLDNKIEKVISTCVPCILASRKTGKKEGFLNPINKGELPLSTLHCDHLGPLEATRKQYNYILTVVDAYTKFVWIYPVKSLTSRETVEKLKLHQKDYGNPSRFVTDRGTAFTGREFEEYCKEEDIEHICITTGIPRGNGQVERMNQIILSILAKMCVEEPTHWYKHISKVQRAINSTYQRSINTSPFELLTGTKLKLKQDLKMVELLEEENRRQFTEKRDDLRREAKAQILRVQEENKKTFNKGRKRGQIYRRGHLVAIKRTQFGNQLKLKPKFFGPYTVTKELGKDRYEVVKVDNSKEGPKKTTTGVDYMKRWS